MSRKVIIILGVAVILIAVITYFLDTPTTFVKDGHTYTYQFSFNTSFNLIQYQKFPNILSVFEKLFDNITSIGKWGSYDIEWYEYIPLFFSWIGKILMFPVDLFKAIFDTLMAIINVIRDFFSCWKVVEVI